MTRDFKKQTEEIRKHMNKLKDENEDLRNRSMRSTLILRGVPENEQSDFEEYQKMNRPATKQGSQNSKNYGR